VTHLLPGNYDVEFLMWENYGGSFAEVFAAHGAKTTVDSTFKLLSPGLFLPSPTVAIQQTSATQVRATWTPTTGCLQSAAAVTGPWTTVVGASSGQTFTVAPGTRFFRVTQ
jgi:hypothetical protein